jgi:hypothetical protein
MTIDPKSGEVDIAGLRVGSNLMENDFLTSDVGKLATLAQSTNGRNWYSIWLPDPGGREAGMTLAFVPGEKLQRIRLKMVKPETRRRGVWSATAEDDMKAFHDQLLRGQLGEPPYNFPWGWIASVIDDHDSSAVIIIIYGARPKTRR